MPRTLVALLAVALLGPRIVHAAPAFEARVPQDLQGDQDQEQDGGPAYEAYSPDQLDNLLSPIALYPDPLLAQLFVAATFPDQVEEGARYVRAYGQADLDDQNWDVSVRAVAHYPTVVEMMADKIDWTTSVGQAYVNQSTDVASSVQRLRHLARRLGNLESSEQEEVLEHDDYIAISPYQPQYIYVPVYDPAIIYYRRPSWGPALTFGIGFPIGAWLNLDFRWGYGGGWGGVYYTGWRQGGWGRDCWNCGWINRSRVRVNVVNNVYVNNRYNEIHVNRTVINRPVNVNNIARYNAVHRNVSYNNVVANNNRANRLGNASVVRPSNRGGDVGPNARPNLTAPPARPNAVAPSATRPGVSHKVMDRNIDRTSPRIDQYRGRSNTPRATSQPAVQPRPQVAAPRPENRPSVQPVRPNAQPTQTRRPAPQVQSRPAPPPQAARPAPHAFSPKETNFNPRISSQRGQASRQAPPARPAPQPRAQSRPAPPPRAPEKKKP